MSDLIRLRKTFDMSDFPGNIQDEFEKSVEITGNYTYVHWDIGEMDFMNEDSAKIVDDYFMSLGLEKGEEILVLVNW